MSAAPLTKALTKGKPSRGETAGGNEVTEITGRPLYRDELAELLPTRDGKRPRRDRVDRDERAYLWALRRAHDEGSPFRSTLQQAAAGMGYEITGDVHTDVCRLFGNNVRRALDSLEAAGLIRWGGIKRPDGRWHCIEIEVLPSSLRAHENVGDVNRSGHGGRRRSRYRGDSRYEPGRRLRRCARARVSFFGPCEVSNPLRGSRSLPLRGSSLDGSTRARGKPPDLPEADPAADQSRWEQGLVAAFEAAFSAPARFSAKRWGEPLGRVLSRLDRYADFGRGRHGAGYAVALGLIAAYAERYAEAKRWARRGEALPVLPGSLAYFIPELEAISRSWRRAHRPRIRTARAAKRAAAGSPRPADLQRLIDPQTSRGAQTQRPGSQNRR